MPSEPSVLREMATDDVPAVMAVQEPASIAGLSGVFPQDEYPFPRDVLADRWRAEIADADIDCFVILRDDEVAGFAAVQADQVKHFGVAVEEWGSGLATTAHDELVARMASDGCPASLAVRLRGQSPRSRVLGQARVDGHGRAERRPDAAARRAAHPGEAAPAAMSPSTSAVGRTSP